MTFSEAFETASTDEERALVVQDERREVNRSQSKVIELAPQLKQPTWRTRLWRSMITDTESGETVLFALSVFWCILLFSDQSSFETSPGLYGGMQAAASEWVWASLLSVGTVCLALGLLTDRADVRGHGLLFLGATWGVAAISQLDSDVFSATPAVMAVMALWFYFTPRQGESQQAGRWLNSLKSWLHI